MPPGAGLLVRRYSCTHSLGVPCRMCVSTANTHAVGSVPSHARPAGGAFLASSASCLDRGSVLGRPYPPRVGARGRSAETQRARTGRCARIRSRRAAHGTRATRGASEHPRVPIFFSAFALRSIIQHKYVAPPAQNPYGLYSMMPCMAAPLPPGGHVRRGPVPLLVPRSLLVQPWAVLGHSVRCTRASMASVPLTPL